MFNRILFFLFMISAVFPTRAALADDRLDGVIATVAARAGYRAEIVKTRKVVVASYYGHYFHGRKMANGQPFNMHAYTVASKSLPLGTKVRLTRGGKSVTAFVTDRGPYVKGRDLDVSLRIAKDLGLIKPGVAPVVMEVLI